MTRKGDILDLTGQQYGYFTVLRFERRENERTYWRCLCVCGKEHVTIGTRLRRGKAKSCGCQRKTFLAKASTKHGYSRHPVYHCYYSMLHRCNNPANKHYPEYGGRGITVCERWQESFENFLADMGDPPQGTSLDRIDNDGPYSPENCRWATVVDQARNKRCTKLATHNGVTKPISQWAVELGIHYQTLFHRHKRTGKLL
jgi:hypothetical protein